MCLIEATNQLTEAKSLTRRGKTVFHPGKNRFIEAKSSTHRGKSVSHRGKKTIHRGKTQCIFEDKQKSEALFFQVAVRTSPPAIRTPVCFCRPPTCPWLPSRNLSLLVSGRPPAAVRTPACLPLSAHPLACSHCPSALVCSL